MIETKQKERVKKPRGVGGVLYKMLMPLENNEKFQQKYAKFNLKLLINAKDTKHAAVVSVNNSKILIESISNKDKKSLKKKVLQWNGMITTTLPLLLNIATGKLSLMGMVKKIISRKIKVRGIKNLLIMKKMFALASRI
jgi:hypothetical protein